MRKGLSNCQCVEENLSASELMGFGARKFLIKRTFLSSSVLNNIYALYLLGPISASILTNKKMSLDTVIYHLTVSKKKMKPTGLDYFQCILIIKKICEKSA